MIRGMGLEVLGIWIGFNLAVLLADFYHIPIGVSLGVIALILTAAIAASFFWPPKEPARLEESKDAPPPPPAEA